MNRRNKDTDQAKTRAPRLGRALFKLVRFLVIFASLILLTGFGLFTLHVTNMKPPEQISKADGIVVLTGPGGGRLVTAAHLLKEGYGERLLVSGINPSTDENTLQGLLKLDEETFTRLVDLDYAAQNTSDNARETVIWAKTLGYEQIILVTSDYHMPRASMEVRGASQQLQIIPYPVKIKKPADTPWWGGRDNLTRLMREYGKLMLAYIRDPGFRPKKP